MDLVAQAKKMTPEAVADLLRRNYELECERKVRHKEAKVLRDEIAKRNDFVAVLNGKLTSADAEAKQLKAQTEELKAQLAWFQRQYFGAKSERRILEALSPADQLWLGQQMLELSEEPPADTETAADIESKGRGRGKGSRKAKPARCDDSLSSRLHFDDSVPIEEVIIKDPQMEALPEDQVEIIGQDVTYKLAQRSPYVVIKTVKIAWKEKGKADIHKAKLPTVVERSIADVSFLAGLAVDKHCHHLPLYRQHQRLVQGGIHIERSTLTRLNQRTAEM